MNTATLRTEARNAERALDWALAADLYRRAIEAYPVVGKGDCLARRDVEALQNKRGACLRMIEA